MNVPGSHTKTITFALVLGACLVPLAVWLWMGVLHVSSAAWISKSQQVQHLAEVKKKLLQDYTAGLLADVRLLALTTDTKTTVATVPPPPEEKKCTPVPVLPVPITTVVDDRQINALRNGFVGLTRFFLQRQLDNVKSLALNDQLASKFVGLDWLFRQNDRKASGDKWQQFTEKFTPRLDTFRKSRRYDDLYLISARGDIFYTSTRGWELGANIMDPGIKDSGLHRLFSLALNQVSFVDVSPYGPEGKRPAAFIGAPVRREGQTIGVVALRFNPLVLLEPVFSARSAPPGTAMAIIGADQGLRFADSAWTGLPESLQTLQSLLQNMDDRPHAVFVPEGSGFQVAWGRFHVDQLEWTLLAALPVPPQPDRPPTPPPASECTSTPRMTVSPNPSPTDVVEKGFGKDYLEITGYYDLFLIHPDGQVFHTAMRQADHGTNLIHGPYADTNLGHLLKRVLETKKPGMSDIAPYSPSRNEPAAFVASPVVVDGKVERVVALQRPLEAVSLLLNPGSLLGPGGDVVLVGPDYRMRSDSFLSPQTHSITASFRGTVPDNGMDNPAVRQALAGQQGLLTTFLPHGGQRITAYIPVAMDNATWALLVSDETGPPANVLSQADENLWILVGGSFVWIGLLAFLIASLVARPWRQLSLVTMELAKGRTEILQGRNGEKWRDSMEPLRLVMERFFLQANRLHSGNVRLLALLAQLRELLDKMSQAKGTDAATSPDSPEAILEALLRWQQIPASVIPSTATKEAEAVGQKLADGLTQIQEIANQVGLLAVNSASLAARVSTKKANLVEAYQRIRELSETVRHLAGEGHDTALSWREKLALTTQRPRIDDILAVLLRRVEHMLKWHSQIIQNQKATDTEDWNAIRALLGEISQQTEKLQHITEALPQKNGHSSDSFPD